MKKNKTELFFNQNKQKMPEFNLLPILVAALVPTIIGAIYYGPLFEKQWLSSLGKTKEEMEVGNMLVTYVGALITAVIVAFFLNYFIEAGHKDVNEAGELIFASTHTFGHGALHGAMFAGTLVCPVIISLGLFQKNTGKNILLNVVYWMTTFAVMGGIMDVWN